MNSSIGAGAVILMGNAAAPTTVTGDMTEYLSNFNIATSMGTVDVTKLNANLDAFFRKHIAGLRDATISANYGDDTAGTFERRIDAIMGGSVHTKGRGKVDVIVRPFGSATGRVQYAFTMIPTGMDQNTEVEAEVGGSFSGQVDGQVVISVQA